MLENSKIIQALIDSCINLDPESFIPCLLDKKVKMLLTKKISFYRYYKYLVNLAKNDLDGNLKVRVKEISTSIEGGRELVFCDCSGRTLINLEFYEDENILYLDAHPF